MPKPIALLFVVITGGGALVLTWAYVYGLWRNGVKDFKDVFAPWVFIIWWSWVAVRVCQRSFIIPARQRRARKSAAEEYVREGIVLGETDAKVATALIRSQFGIKLEARYRSQGSADYDQTIEIEDHAFTVVLFVSDGLVIRWSVN